MAVEMRVRGLRRAFRRMEAGARKSAKELPPVMTKAMADEFIRVLKRDSKRKGRPRRARFMPGKGGGGQVLAGWYGRDYSGAEEYVDRAQDAAAKVGFRRGARKVRRRFAAIQLG